jgi:hypothetical protein
LAIWDTGTNPGAVEVDCTKLQLITAVIARAPSPQAPAFKVAANTFMVVSPYFLDGAICPMHFVVVMVLYMTTSLHECQARSPKNFKRGFLLKL